MGFRPPQPIRPPRGCPCASEAVGPSRATPARQLPARARVRAGARGRGSREGAGAGPGPPDVVGSSDGHRGPSTPPAGCSWDPVRGWGPPSPPSGAGSSWPLAAAPPSPSTYFGRMLFLALSESQPGRALRVPGATCSCTQGLTPVPLTFPGLSPHFWTRGPVLSGVEGSVGPASGPRGQGTGQGRCGVPRGRRERDPAEGQGGGGRPDPSRWGLRAPQICSPPPSPLRIPTRTRADVVCGTYCSLSL